jgi:predicted peptidase
LVLFLHGTGERGSDNETQLLCYEGALVWAKPEQQSKNSCYVIAPQAPMADKVTSFWTDEPVYSMLLSLIKEAIDKYPIDANHIYITSLSNGGTSINYTEFNGGTVKPYGHAAWAPAYQNNDMINWLFEQSK